MIRVNEFQSTFLALMKANNVKLNKSLDKKKVAFVERFNRTLAEELFKPQYTIEMQTGQTNREWVQNLPHVIETLKQYSHTYDWYEAS